MNSTLLSNFYFFKCLPFSLSPAAVHMKPAFFFCFDWQLSKCAEASSNKKYQLMLKSNCSTKWHPSTPMSVSQVEGNTNWQRCNGPRAMILDEPTPSNLHHLSSLIATIHQQVQDSKEYVNFLVFWLVDKFIFFQCFYWTLESVHHCVLTIFLWN